MEDALGGRKTLKKLGTIILRPPTWPIQYGPPNFNYLTVAPYPGRLKRKKNYTPLNIGQALGHFPGNLQMRDQSEMIGLINLGQTGGVQLGDIYAWAALRCAYMLTQAVFAQFYVFGFVLGQKSSGTYIGPNVGMSKAGSQFSEGSIVKLSTVKPWLNEKTDYKNFIDSVTAQILFSAAHISTGPVFVNDELLSRKIRSTSVKLGIGGSVIDSDLASRAQLLAIQMEGLESHTLPQPQTFNKMEYDYFESLVRDAFPPALQKLLNFGAHSKKATIQDKLSFFMETIVTEMAQKESTLGKSALDPYYIDYMDCFLYTLGEKKFQQDSVELAEKIWQERFRTAPEILEKLGRVTTDPTSKL
jgi:hypothetical protein